MLGDTLRIHGQRREERREAGEGQRWLLREQRYETPSSGCSRLPSSVKADQAWAEFHDRILSITLPKAEETKERRIPVRAGQQGQEVPIEAETKGGKAATVVPVVPPGPWAVRTTGGQLGANKGGPMDQEQAK